MEDKTHIIMAADDLVNLGAKASAAMVKILFHNEFSPSGEQPEQCKLAHTL